MNHQTLLHNRGERGDARLKFIIFLAIVVIVGYAGYMYIPVAIDAYYFKDAMQNKVNLAAAQGTTQPGSPIRFPRARRNTMFLTTR